MSDEELLSHCLNSLKGEYGEIANTMLVERLEKRLSSSSRVVDALAELHADGTLSPAEHRRLLNRPWHDKASY